MLQHLNYVNGSWQQGCEIIANTNPSDISDVIGEIHRADNNLVHTAIDSAKEAQKEWAKMGIEQRSNILQTIGNLLIEQKQALGELLAREEGKTKPEGIGEVARAGQFFQYYAAETLRQIGDFVDSVRPGVEVEVLREPVGVVLVITPWNFPMALPAWKIAPALAFGNAVIFKPAELTPASACALMSIIHQAGVPAGVVQMLLGSGARLGQFLLQHPGINVTTFTGSQNVGKIVARTSAERLKPYQLEMGSKNALIVLDDCDLDNAVACAVNGAFSSTGQKCTSTSRLIVTEGIYAEFKRKFVEATSKLVVGHALTEGSHLGPCASQSQLETNQYYFEKAIDEGASLVYQGVLAPQQTQGYYFTPVIFEDTTNDMTINREEVFGPITCLQRANDYQHALALVNDSEYGLTAGIATSSLKYATHFKRNAEAGCVMVNLPTAGTDYHVPFGGTKMSSQGPREQGRYAVDFYTKIKTAYIKA